MIQEIQQQQAIVKDLEQRLQHCIDEEFSDTYNSYVAAQRRLRDMTKAYLELENGKKTA